MDPDRWDRLQQVFAAALERSGPDRIAFVNEACADEPELRGRLLSMLQGAEESWVGVDDVVQDAVEQALEDSVPRTPAERRLPAPGDRLGRYRVESEIGRGGMGTVFMAVRDDAEFHKRVAIKLIRGGGDDREALRRFRAERQILATLEHPNVARLLDAGAADDGSPYVVMEFVEGQPIDHYCDDRKLDIQTRLVLFQKVCAAVQAAHRRLVVHRDIKPNNILVTPDGTPKLLDFGIAKLLDPELLQEPTAHTATSVRVMTPDYAAPEQIRGEPITVATDVYALGVLLFELLTGERPYRLKHGHLGELERAITDQEPTRPSLVASSTEESGELRRLLSGDLDAIVLKSLRKEPLQRYDSVTALAADVDRHLSGLPVLAQRGNWRYLTGKFVRRHRAGVAVASVLALAVVGGIVGTSVGLIRARQAEQQARLAQADAEREARTAGAVGELLMDVMFGADPLQRMGKTFTVRELVDRAADRISPEVLEDPVVLAKMQGNLGLIYSNLGELPEAIELFQSAIATRDAAGIGGRIQGETLNNLGWMLMIEGRNDEAEAVLQRGLEYLQGEDREDRTERARVMSNLGGVYQGQGRLNLSEQAHRDALELRRSIDPDHRDVGMSLMMLGRVLDGQERSEEGLQLMLEARELVERVAPEDLASLAEVVQSVGHLKARTGDFDGAVAPLEHSLELAITVYGERHPLFADTQWILGQVHRLREEPAESRRCLNAALEVFRHHFGEDDDRVQGVLADLALLDSPS